MIFNISEFNIVICYKVCLSNSAVQVTVGYFFLHSRDKVKLKKVSKNHEGTSNFKIGDTTHSDWLCTIVMARLILIGCVGWLLV